ncbi:MAG: tetratricopeptide repeat protein [Zymomonas mobilis subsp. pomaceae]|uniref:Tetratricopeptide repeat protein n=1 Tax=Zymomonas mobilis subsp. pomaceae (strain ATCC 29192 / DSM 22645 / JCM 10191 / CCUG 17912 / NBRC 13757 / NCIMB 11200 / NRRL B-4491 / Barker I) TaxID=579138 RepID=F8EVI0_ZYMMT|nr:tetratricopeptide repeat protein [Zymomonas mobilis]AEI37387.1 Tetratricopeptide repeat protein [Zymomonas mobilis subsp. pomaceae ATCC 29192]MDX5948755.1 tetratricopeptide repeat protein [Zymomonas mobilis subsp. pomaceae]GEB88559.1 hypothetical protein ZMO02_01960 [Zymomonas mobilis subsp. pomaceae]
MLFSLLTLLAAGGQLPAIEDNTIPMVSLPKSPNFLATGPREEPKPVVKKTPLAPQGKAESKLKKYKYKKKDNTLQVVAPPASLKQRYDHCINMIDEDPEQAAEIANTWRLSAGGVLANQCLGMAYVALGRYSAGVDAFEQAARESDLEHDGRSAIFWIQAGNAALANQDPGAARGAFDHALMLSVLPDKMRGNTLSDRARADVALHDYASARQDIDKALKLIGKDGSIWLMSATLARQQGDLERAKKDIIEGEKIAPLDAQISFEKGLIFALSGEIETARAAWDRTIRANPKAELAEVARKAMDEMEQQNNTVAAPSASSSTTTPPPLKTNNQPDLKK